MGAPFIKEMPGILKRKTALYTTVGLILVAIVFGFTYIIVKQNSNTINRFNQQLAGVARTSTVYLVGNYELYGSPQTIKFQNIVRDFLNENSEITKFSIFDTGGLVVFDSENPGSTTKNVVDTGIISYSRNDEITALKDKNKIITLVSPYFEEWGSHKYSVLFYPSYSKVNEDNWQFSLQLGIITILSVAVIAAIALLLTINVRYKLHKEEKEKLESVDNQRQEFLMLVAHNLRTPITIIQGYISLLAEKEVSIEQKEMIAPVSEAVKRLYLLVEQMLTITDVVGRDNLAIEKQELNLRGIVSGVISDYREKINEKGLEVAQDYSPQDMQVYTNERYIKMVLTFLIDNAVKFNKNQGKITIRGVLRDNQTVISITDTGIGIAEAEQGNIFVKFHKLDVHKSIYDFNYAGSGLGLYTTKVIIEALGGKIWFESTEGIGTAFYLSFPVNHVIL